MARYLIEAVATPQTLAAMVRKPEDRAEQAKSIFARLGGRLESYDFGVGNGRHYAIVAFEAPLDAITLEALWIALWAPGVVMTQTITQLLTSAEMVDAFKRVGDVGYRPPG